MMADRYSRPKQRSWFVPTVVVVGIAAFFLWESGWRPFEIVDVPTGSIGTQTASSEDANNAAITAMTDAGAGAYGLPDIKPQQFEPNVDDLNPDDLMDVFDQSQATSSAAATAAANERIKQVAFESDTTGFDASDFTDLSPPTNLTPDIAAPPTRTQPQTPTPPPRPASQMSAELRAKLNKIDFLLDENDYLTAHRDLSTLYWYEPANREFFRDRIQHTAKSIYAAAQPHYMEPYVVKSGDTLSKIAAEYNVPWTYLARLNNVSAGRVRTGSKLKVIRGPFGAVVDLSDFELTVHAHGYYVRSYKIGIGKGQSTPIGEFKVGSKLENPTYYPPEGGSIDGDDPTNPLGEFWLGLGDGYGIHGTIDPNSIGKAESKGCIRLNTNDIAEVFDLLTEGSTVMIRR